MLRRLKPLDREVDSRDVQATAPHDKELCKAAMSQNFLPPTGAIATGSSRRAGDDSERGCRYAPAGKRQQQQREDG